MRIVLDTNTLVSALISPTGPPRQLLNGAKNKEFKLYSSPVLLAELHRVISRNKFAKRFQLANLDPLEMINDISRLSIVVSPIYVPHIIADDPDDDHVLACAIASNANLIVSGDKHILNLGNNYQGITIVIASKAIEIIHSLKQH